MENEILPIFSLIYEQALDVSKIRKLITNHIHVNSQIEVNYIHFVLLNDDPVSVYKHDMLTSKCLFRHK